MMGLSLASASVYAQQEEIDVKSAQIKELEREISRLSEESGAISAKYEQLKRWHEIKRSNYEQSKDAYTRASQNVDIISHEQLTQHLLDYKKADKELNASRRELQKTKSDKAAIDSNLKRLKDEKREKEIRILEIKAEMYENQLSGDVWAEGYGECILDENKTMKSCQQLALDYAKRDAAEKGGKSLIEAVTEVDMFELTRDEITKTTKVNIIEQDNSGDYGKAIRVISGDMIKFSAKVRIKVQSVATFNPYREKVKELRKTGAEPPHDEPTARVVDNEDQKRQESDRLERERLEKERFDALQRKVDQLERERDKPVRKEREYVPPAQTSPPERKRTYTPLPGF